MKKNIAKLLVPTLFALFLTLPVLAHADDVTTIRGKITLTSDNQPAFTAQWFDSFDSGIMNWIMGGITVSPSISLDMIDLSLAQSVTFISPVLPAKCLGTLNGVLNQNSTALLTVQFTGDTCEPFLDSMVLQNLQLKITHLPIGNGVVLPTVMLFVDKP